MLTERFCYFLFFIFLVASWFYGNHVNQQREEKTETYYGSSTSYLLEVYSEDKLVDTKEIMAVNPQVVYFGDFGSNFVMVRENPKYTLGWRGRTYLKLPSNYYIKVKKREKP